MSADRAVVYMYINELCHDYVSDCNATSQSTVHVPSPCWPSRADVSATGRDIIYH